MEIRQKSALPIYTVGAVWVLGALLLPIYKLPILLAVAAASLAAYFVAAKRFPDRVVQRVVETTPEESLLQDTIQTIQQNRQQLHGLNERIPDDELSCAIERMEKACDGIASRLQVQGDVRQVRRFVTYYLPDAVKILSLYAELDEQGLRGENAQSVRKEVEENAAVIASAFENQLDSLYAARAMDISTDLEVLKGMLQGQGLV